MKSIVSLQHMLGSHADSMFPECYVCQAEFCSLVLRQNTAASAARINTGARLFGVSASRKDGSCAVGG